MTPLHLIFSGSGEFGVPTLRALRDAGHSIALVVTQPDRPAGRGRGVQPTAIAAEAMKIGLPVLRTENINKESLPPADVMVVIAFGQKIGDAVVHHPRLGSINLHASLLPKYRGAAPINWAIINGEETSGNSIIRLAQKMDAGAMLAQSEVRIGESETAGELHDRLAQDGAPLVLRVLEDLANGKAVEQEQDPLLATTAPKLARETARLEFATNSAVNLAHKIRGLSPWPGCRVNVCDAASDVLDTLRLVRAVAGPTEGDRWEPGEIMLDGLVATAEGGLEILEVQPAGKRAMPLADYRRGNRWYGGLRLAAAD